MKSVLHTPGNLALTNLRAARRAVLALLTILLLAPTVRAENNGVALTPPMGWSSWSHYRENVSQSKIEATAQSMHNSLQQYGFQYVNVDDGWYLDPKSTVDQYGRWAVNTSTFPNGINGLASYVHGLGLKFGIYLTSGVPKLAYSNNTPIEGTNYHAQDAVTNTSAKEEDPRMYVPDFSKPAAQAFFNAWANQLASWGVDYIKLDYTSIPADVQGWSVAIAQCGRPIHLELSYALPISQGASWKAYSNGWRIESDIENYGGNTLTNWNAIKSRMDDDAQGWTWFGGRGGWNDLDSLEIGNGSNDGLTTDERKSTMSFWSIAAAPYLLGSDLTALDSGDLALLSNTEVIGIDQGGVPGAPLAYSTSQEVWRARQASGSYAVDLINRSGSTADVSVKWTSMGITGPASVRDLWAHSNLGMFNSSFSTTLNSHASGLYLVTPTTPAAQYLADSPANTLSGGARVNPMLSANGTAGANVTTNGADVIYIGEGGTLTFNNVIASTAGKYNVTFLYLNGDTSRNATISVNGGTATSYSFPGTGSFTAMGSMTLPLQLAAGANTIELSNPSGYAPDFDSITVQATFNSPIAGRHVIANVKTGQAIDNDSTSTEGAGVVQRVPNGSSAQEWTFTQNPDTTWTITSQNSGYVLDDPSFSKLIGAQMDQWSINGGANQKWIVTQLPDGSYEILNQYSNDVLDGSSSTVDKYKLIQWTWNSQTQQHWNLK